MTAKTLPKAVKSSDGTGECKGTLKNGVAMGRKDTSKGSPSKAVLPKKC